MKRVSNLMFGIVPLVFVFACGKEQSAPEQHGRELFISKNCTLCHGVDGGGTENAPALRNLERFHSRETIVEYLRDPDAFAREDDRLSRQMMTYPVMMPRFGYLDERDLKALADYVIGL